jgi:type IV secretory pathway VirB10-like protein
MTAAVHTAAKEPPEALALRAKPRAVTRLSKKALILLGGVSALTIGGLAIWALGAGHGGAQKPEELYSTDHKAVAEGLNTLPRDYAGMTRQPVLPAGVPQLGPPMPGDLGRPFLRAQEESGVAPSPGGSPLPPAAPAAAAAAPSQRQQEAVAAVRGTLFVQTGQRSGEVADTKTAGEPSTASGPDPLSALSNATMKRADKPSTSTAQDRKSAFLAAPSNAKIYASGQLQTPASPYQVMAGTLIPAAMVTGLNSDLPGQAIATVTEPVYDTVTGRTLLIPQGSRLIGTYDAQVGYGQSRVLLVWTRLIMPDGSSIVLDRLSGADTQGYAGLSDRTNNHWGRLLAGAALSTMLGVGAELGSQNSGLGGTGQQTVVVASSLSAEQSANQVGQQITRRDLDVQPTLTVRPGFPVRVIVNKDLVLRPYGASEAASTEAIR